MPKGSFGGGGGFSGGSGFRGGSSSFRTSSFGSSSSSFGRTGATRINNSSYRTSTYHSSYSPYSSPYNRPYGYGFSYGPRWGWGRPWYGRSRMWGSWHRPWYSSPINCCGGICLMIILSMIFLPIFGIMMAFPFGSSNADVNGDVSYRSTETLNYNEYWYEKETLKANGQITFNIASTGAPITFVITDKQFASFPTKTVTKNLSGHDIILEENEYWYESMFLSYGSKISYNYNTSNGIEFLIADGDNAVAWSNNNQYSALVDTLNSKTDNGSKLITQSTKQDYYIIWYNSNSFPISLNFSVQFLVTGVYNFSSAFYCAEATTNVASVQPITVPNAGDWYFYVYFDPTQSKESSTTISFDVTFKTGITATDKWENIRPFLIGLAVVVGCLILIGVIARNIQKKKQQPASSSSTSPPLPATPPINTSTASVSAPTPITFVSPPVQPVSQSITTVNIPSTAAASPPPNLIITCINCGSKLDENAEFCSNCGKKREGRAFGVAPSPPKVQSKYCYYCGDEIRNEAKYCVSCGAKTE